MSSLTLKHDGVTYLNASPDGLLNAQVPDAVIAAAVQAARAEAIAAVCDRRIADVIGAKAASIQREAIYLQNLAFRGQALTPEQTADVEIIMAINAWETAMIAHRQALAADPAASFGADAGWPAAPAAVTPAWLAGF
jgi:hypothetical protein